MKKMFKSCPSSLINALQGNSNSEIHHVQRMIQNSFRGKYYILYIFNNLSSYNTTNYNFGHTYFSFSHIFVHMNNYMFGGK
jgi:CRISPR/Cas system-associated endonuclease Cas3-HD